MARFRTLLILAAAAPLLAGCYADQQKQLSACKVTAPSNMHAGEPFNSIRACMDKAGYRFIGWDPGIVCDMHAVVTGVATGAFQTGALCFEPKDWLALKLYRLEVPIKKQPAG